jgi:hypothetical protein
MLGWNGHWCYGVFTPAWKSQGLSRQIVKFNIAATLTGPADFGARRGFGWFSLSP